MQTPPPNQPSPGAAPLHSKGKWRRRLKLLAIVTTVTVVLLAAMIGGAEYYTARPEFCGSCHIMDPYYDSWQKDVHSTKVEAACVDCHYAPGEEHTVMAKFRGLSQAASYFSGRAGAGRPKAHVKNESCMTSECHGDQKFMTSESRLGTVVFVHAKHLDPDSEMIRTRRQQLADLRKKLAGVLGPDRMKAVEAVARPIRPTEVRNPELTHWLDANRLSDHREDVLEFAQLLHTEVRLEQLRTLKCASCHQFNPSVENHFTLARTTCYTCHFLNEPFNANTGSCVSCHAPPSRKVAVHTAPPISRQPSAPPSEEAITVDHATILANNVDCVSCHADLLHGTGEVTRRDCQNCHDQERYLRDFDNRTTDLVVDYHRVHAGGQHARCNDCHRVIEHRLLPVASAGDVQSLLAPVRDNCQHCHPNHHQEQVQLLLGQGGHVSGTSAPNPMAGSRANCRACHTQAGDDPKGDRVITGTLTSCRGCHGQDYEELFTRWQRSIQARQDEAQALLAKVQQRLGPTTQPVGPDAARAAELVSQAADNIKLVVNANGIHNKNYSLMLLDQAIVDLENATTLLNR